MSELNWKQLNQSLNEALTDCSDGEAEVAQAAHNLVRAAMDNGDEDLAVFVCSMMVLFYDGSEAWDHMYDVMLLVASML